MDSAKLEHDGMPSNAWSIAVRRLFANNTVCIRIKVSIDSKPVCNELA